MKEKCTRMRTSTNVYYLLNEKGLLSTNKIIYILGAEAKQIASCLMVLYEADRKVVLITQQDLQLDLASVDKIKVEIAELSKVVFYLVDDMGTYKWNIGMFTSGSTLKSRLYVFTRKQIDETLEWYRQIYGMTEDTLIISPLPPAYSFTYIAGILNAYKNNSEYLYTSAESVYQTIEQKKDSYDKIVLLANPVILDYLSAKQYDVSARAKLLIDSGGASLSTKAIKHFRNMGFNLREGYGLAETCSLSTFDIEGNDKSIGTVGKALEGVSISLNQRGENDLVNIKANNIGTQITMNGVIIEEVSDVFQTTDIGRINDDGLLTILGRYNDFPINGFYPKDSLECIADIIGAKCALIQHPTHNTAIVELYDYNLLKVEGQIRIRLSYFLNIPISNIEVRIDKTLLKTMKQVRKKNIKNEE